MADKNKYNSLLSLYGSYVAVEYDKRVIIEIHLHPDRYPHLYEAVEREFASFIASYDFWTNYHDDCCKDYFFSSSGRKLRIDRSAFFGYIDYVHYNYEVDSENKMYNDFIQELTEAYCRVILPTYVDSVEIGINYISDPTDKEFPLGCVEDCDKIEISLDTDHLLLSSMFSRDKTNSTHTYYSAFPNTDNALKDIEQAISKIDLKMQLKELKQVTLPDDYISYGYYFLKIKTSFHDNILTLRSDNSSSFMPVLDSVLPWLSDEERMFPTVQRIEELYKTN